jgi:hypothetical protein
MIGCLPGAASAAAAPRITLTPAIAIPSANTAPMTNMIASIHGDVIATVGPVQYPECEVLHTASDLFIGHKARRPYESAQGARVA